MHPFPFRFIAALLILLLPQQQAGLAAPAAAPLIPAEVFGDLPFLEDPTLSPDGTRIAAKLHVGGKPKIGIWPAANASAAAPRIISPGESDILWIRWAGNDRLLIGSNRKHLLLGQPILVGQTAVYDLSQQRGAVLDTGTGFLGDQVMHVDPDGRFALIAAQRRVTEYPRVLRVDLATGQAVEVERARRGVMQWFADSQGVVRAGVEYGQRRYRILYRRPGDDELRAVDSERYPRDGSVIDLVRFTDQIDRGIVISNANTGRFAVHEYDFAANAIGSVIFEHPEVDVTAIVAGADGAVDGVSYEDDRYRVHWLNPAMRSLQQSVDRALPGKTNVIVNSSRDGNRHLIWSGSGSAPPVYYVFDRSERRMEVFAAPFSRLHDRTFAEVRHVRFPSRDGLSIAAYLTLPVGRPERSLPLIVLPHGGPFLRDSWTFNSEVQFLANRGYAVLQPNFRGSTGYGKSFVELGYGQLGGGMIDDMEAGVDWLVQQGIVDPQRVCMMGSSYGGYAALWASIRSPQRFRCAISWAAPTDLRAILRYDQRTFAAYRYNRERQLELQGEDRINLDTISPLKQFQRLRVPVLIAHGEKDERVPVDHSRDLITALKRHDPTLVESYIYPEAAHSFTRSEDSVDFMRRVEAFLARHNPA